MEHQALNGDLAPRLIAGVIGEVALNNVHCWFSLLPGPSIGFIDANTGDIYQTLPWNHRGWHGGGSSNNTHIGVEMCEPAAIKGVHCVAHAEALPEVFRVAVVAGDAPGVALPMAHNYAVLTIVEESTGQGAALWGKLKSGKGWIALGYTEKV